MKRLTLFTLIAALAASGCRKQPLDSTSDASKGGPLNGFGAVPAMVIFSDELFTGGGAFEYPGGENQTLSFTDTSNPVSRRSIRYNWNGNPPKAGDTSFIFAGFDLDHVVDISPDLPNYNSTPGRDLRQAGYGKVTFFARGSLASLNDLKIEVSDDGNTNTPAPCIVLYQPSALASGRTTPIDQCVVNGAANPYTMAPQVLGASWQQYSITVPNALLASVKDFFKATIIFNNPIGNLQPGQGGTVYFDQIQYQP